MAEATFVDLARLQADADTADVALAMDEEAFRAFYDGTARSVWLYILRVTHVTRTPGAYLIGGTFTAPLTYQEFTALVM